MSVRKSKKIAAPVLSVEDQFEYEITLMQPKADADARVDAAMSEINARIVVESAASESVVPAAPVNEGPVAPADVPSADQSDEDAYETGEFVIPDGRALAHAIGSATDTDFTAVCGRTYALTGATMAGALSDRCAYCEDGDIAPADTDDEPATLKPRTGRATSTPVAVTDPEHVSQFASMLTALTGYVESHGNGADARAFYAALTGAADAFKPLCKRDRSTRPASADGTATRTYVRLMPTGRVSVTLKLPGESEPVSMPSMGDACRKLAACLPTAEKCAAYVKRVDELKLTANARVYLQADIDAGHIPADVVSFGSK